MTKKAKKLSPADKDLFQAARGGDLAGVQAALKAGAEVGAREEYGDTALNVAAEAGHLEIVKHLLEAGANIENLGGADKTPIMNAAFAGHVPVVQYLFEHGAIINNDLLNSVAMKVGILEENAEAGMVLPEAVAWWKQFMGNLVQARQIQDAKK